RRASDLFHPARPAELVAAPKQRLAERAGEMMPAQAPVEAGAAKRPPSAFEPLEVDAEALEGPPAGGRDRERALVHPQEPAPGEAVEEAHAELASEMVVAHARLARRRLARAEAKRRRARARGDAHERREEPRHVAIGEAEVAVAPLAFDGEETRVEELRQM